MNSVNEKRIQRAGIIIFLLIPILLYAKYYLNNQIPGNADLVQYFSARKHFVQCLLNGELPQWNGYLANGMPTIGNFYIISILLSFLPLKQYIYAYFIVHLFIGSYFFYRYLRECKCSYVVSMIFAVIYECSIQINGLRKSHPTIIASICLFPVIMFFVKKFIDTRENKWLCLSAVMAAVQATIGQQYSVYAVMILFVYIVVSCLCEKFTIKDLMKRGILWLGVYVGIFAYALLPNLSIMRQYKVYGSAGTSFDTFSTYSIHPVKLIQMIIPRFFGDIYQPLGNYYSSEMDIELYLGIFVLLLAVTVILLKKDKWSIKLDLACAVIAFLYASIAHIPVLNHIVHKLPLLGGFRCAGRMLFIFYFFILAMAAKGLHSLIQGELKESDLKYMKNLAKIFFTGIAVLGIVSAFLISLLMTKEQQPEYYYKLQSALILPLVFLALILIVLSIVQKKECLRWKLTSALRVRILCGAIVVITLAEILPFSLITEPTPLAQFETVHPVEEQLKENIGGYKIWDAFDNVDGAHESIISQNKSASKEIAALNAYTAYNNPLIFKYFKNLGIENNTASFNFSGLLTGSKNVKNNVIFQNDLLSMLGVRYVIDSCHVVENMGGQVYDSQCKADLVNSKENISLDFLENGVGVSTVMEGIAANTCYKVSLKIKNEHNAALTHLAVDLFGGDNYDLAPQEKQFYLTKNSNEYVAYLYSENAEQATEDIRIRILAKSNLGEVLIERCEVSRVQPRQAYQYWNTDKYGMKIYENTNAKDILYFPQKVSRLENFDDIYDNYEKYDLSNIAYGNRESMNLEDINSEAEVISRTSNTLTAKITSDADTYLCFSQNYSPNWSVEIDGKKQKPEMINGLIMGVAVPSGEHTIVFQYFDWFYVVGSVLTALTAVLLIAGLIWGHVRRQ